MKGYRILESILKFIFSMMNDFRKHENITEILGLDLTCPHCKKVLVTIDERKEERKEKPEDKNQ